MVVIKQELEIALIKDEIKVKDNETKTIRSVKLSNSDINLTLTAEKEDHPLESLTSADIGSEAKLTLDIRAFQKKLDGYIEEEE